MFSASFFNRLGRAGGRGRLVNPITCCLLLLAAIVSLNGSCDRPLSLAVGPSGDITVFTALPEGSPEVTALVDGLQREVVYIGKPELVFNVEVSGPDGFHIRRNWRNLVFLGSLDDGSWSREMIQSLLSQESLAELRDGTRNLFFVKDKWAVGQMIAILATAESDRLAAAVADNIGALYTTMDRAVVENTRRIMLRKDVQQEMIGYLRRTYGWELTLPKGYEGIEDSEHQVVVFRAQEPTRIISVYWRDGLPELPTVERCLAIRGELAWNYYDEDRIDYDLTTTKRTTFLGIDAIEIDGVWQNEKYVNGGPFKSYCFTERNRFYLIDLVLFAPGMDKLPYMRELEAIAQTFSAG
jgi:hypothetical protein